MTAPGRSRTGAAIWSCLRVLARQSGRRWPLTLGVVALALPSALVAAALPWPAKVVVDNVLLGQPATGAPGWLVDVLPGAGSPSGLLLWAAAATVVLFSLRWALDLLNEYASVTLGQRLTYDLAGRLLMTLQRMSLRYHARRGAGDTVRRTLVDTAAVAGAVVGTVLPLLFALALVGTVVGVMWTLDPELLLLALLALPLTGLAIWRLSPSMVERTVEQQDQDGGLYSQVEQVLTAAPVVQVFGQERRVTERFAVASEAAVAAALRATAAQARFRIGVSLAAAVPTALVLYTGTRHVLAGTLTLGELLVFLAYLETFYAPVHTFVYAPESMNSAAGSASRVLEVLEARPEVADRPRAQALRSVRGDLVVDDVVYGYEPGSRVLDGVQLEIPPGRTLAVVGESGAGKTTLLSLLPRFNDPWSGRVLLDGHDLRDVRLSSLRQHMALVLQEPFLFPMSVAGNIAYGRPDADRAAVVRAARAANAHEFIAALPDGYDTKLGERGARLSGGQRQRVAIARALLKDAPVLLLDEPTSALDSESERLLLEALDRLMAGRTTLIIAHRLSTIRNADEIAVLDQGRVVERGTHSDLLAHGDHYARLHASAARSRGRRPRAVAPPRPPRAAR